MPELVLASANLHKLEEIQKMAPPGWWIIPCGERGIIEDIPENEKDLEGNALAKARYVHARIGGMVLSDDSGLEVAALDGRPGVFSARYAGPGCTARDNCRKLLDELGDSTNRAAVFRTVLCLMGAPGNPGPLYFEGRVNGTITTEMKGEQGFGYDPVFVPKGRQQTFAQMPAAEKNAISHRARALQLLKDHWPGVSTVR